MLNRFYAQFSTDPGAPVDVEAFRTSAAEEIARQARERGHIFPLDADLRVRVHTFPHVTFYRFRWDAP